MPGEDTLISKGFSIEEAKSTAEAFENFCNEHSDEIEALRIIYNNEGGADYLFNAKRFGKQTQDG